MERIKTNITKKVNSDFSFQLPYGYIVDNIVFSSENVSPFSINIGTTPLGDEIIAGYPIEYGENVLRLGYPAPEYKKEGRFQPRRHILIYINDVGSSWSPVRINVNLKPYQS